MTQSDLPSTPSILSLDRDELGRFCAAQGQSAYRARQVWQWLYARQVSDWESMTSLPAAFRAELAARFCIDAALPLQAPGDPDATRKILVGLRDGERVEAVIIPAGARHTVCVSTQVGCTRQCAFCASGQAGWVRNLEVAEMVGQVLLAARMIGKRPTNLVYMGIGEPFDNYDAVLKSIRIVNDDNGLAIGVRKITLSTSGVIPGIERLAGENLQVELSVSLHAARSDLRSMLMPVNRRYPLPDLLSACRAYSEKTGRIVTFEYTLIRGVNDSREDAVALADQLAAFPCRVNFLLLSPVPEYAGQPALPETARMFMAVLAERHINATLRQSRGCFIHAACGQLRRA